MRKFLLTCVGLVGIVAGTGQVIAADEEFAANVDTQTPLLQIIDD